MINIWQKIYMYKPIFFIVFHIKKYWLIALFLFLLTTGFYFLWEWLFSYPMEQSLGRVGLAQAIGTILVPTVALGATTYIAWKQYALEKARDKSETKKNIMNIFQTLEEITTIESINLMQSKRQILWSDISKQFLPISRTVLNFSIQARAYGAFDMEKCLYVIADVTRFVTLEFSSALSSYGTHKHKKDLSEKIVNRWSEFSGLIILSIFTIEFEKRNNPSWKEAHKILETKHNLDIVLENFKKNRQTKETLLETLYNIELNLLDERALS